MMMFYLHPDYIKSAKCFQSQNLIMSVGSCVTVMSTLIQDPEVCYYFENFVKCIDELQDSNCDQNDKGLLNKIWLSYIHPLGTLYKCPGYERLETTTSTTQTPPTTTTLETATDSTTTSTTAAATQDEAEIAPKTGSAVDKEKGGAVLITQNLLIKCLATSLVGFISIYLTTKC
ncbi:hypothetical protein Btru_043383 [Bulinus truncatus]|nr:hypothetical protein Btru_043383 [Bulinus truncatus]